MRVSSVLPVALLSAFALGACGPSGSENVVADSVSGCDSQAALATCVKPTMSPEYYVDQANKYFDTLDSDAPTDSIPNYSELVARWEWPPWLKLTGIGKTILIASDLAVTRAGTPSTVPERDCRAFDVQPFARCYVVIEYDGGPCPIYEEFAFNDAGEMTFIEAWSSTPGLLPFDANADKWAEQSDLKRLSTLVPGLGNERGLIDPDAPWMDAAAAEDEDIADFQRRAQDFWVTWVSELEKHGSDFSEESLYGYGCGWPGVPEP